MELLQPAAAPTLKGHTVDMAIQSPPSEQAQSRELTLEFTGSGSEYFRIWIVNLLLTVCTLGTYFPWAKVRKLRYFYGNTMVGGEPLGFHGDPKKMFKGYALVALLFACYSGAGKFSPGAGLVALLVIAGLWPALLKSSMQFRLTNTSWRGLRFHFSGSLEDAYKAVLPMWLPAAFIVGLTALQGPGWATDTWAGRTWFILLSLGTVALWPCLLWKLKKYQHTHYALGTQQTSFTAGVSGFYKLAAKLFASYVVVCALVPLMLYMGGAAAGQEVNSAGDKASKLNAMLAFGLLPMLMTLFVAVYAYALARAQDLVWNHTASRHIRFHSHLRFRDLLWLTIKNWFFMLITLGLYWPFAAVATRRLRLQAISIRMNMPEDQLAADKPEDGAGAAGDAATEVFGFDIGL